MIDSRNVSVELRPGIAGIKGGESKGTGSLKAFSKRRPSRIPRDTVHYRTHFTTTSPISPPNGNGAV